MVDEADADGSGSINFPEFIELMLKKQAGGQTKDEIKQVSQDEYRDEIGNILNFDHHVNNLLRNCKIKYNSTFLARLSTYLFVPFLLVCFDLYYSISILGV